jgi:hypothetical protein
MIIRTRRRLINAARALQDHGAAPPGLDEPELFEMYSGCAIVPEEQDGLDATDDLQHGRAQLAEIPAGGS